MPSLNDIKEKLQKLPDAELKKILSTTSADCKAIGMNKWIPTVGPQMDAYVSAADIIGFGGEPGGGKGLNIQELIATPSGFTQMGELAVGDSVIADDGRPCRVTAKSTVFFEDTYKIVFSDGSEIVAGENHQWKTSTRAERMRALKCNDEWREKRRAARPSRSKGTYPKSFVDSLSLRNSVLAKSTNPPTESIKTTSQIAATLRRYDGGVNHAVAVCAPLVLEETPLLICPYVLGVWLGDGSKNCGQIAGLDEEIFQQVANSYPVKILSNKYVRGTKGLQSDLRSIGVLGNKHIPPAYLRASMEQRLALLQGLMDTDGYCDKRGQCEIQLTRKELIDGVQELLHTLGIKAQMREGDATLYGRIISRKWRLKFLTDLPAFRLPRKLIRQKRSAFRGTHDVRYVVSCEPVERVPLQCIQVDSPSHCYLAGRAMIPTHNSQLGLGFAFNEHKRSLILRRQYTDLSGLIDDAIKIHGSRVGFNGQPPPRLTIASDQFIDFGACARIGDEQHWMGKAHDLICADESTQFAWQQIRFLMGWLRHENPKQRTRVLLPTNPPLSAEGWWYVDMFAPWLDDRYPYPAKPGELRYVVTDAEGKDKWVDGPQPVMIAGRMMTPLSRTFIPSSLDDNPFYAAGDYRSRLDAMAEPHRSILLGKFKTSFKDQPNQVIPTAWIREAQERWTPKPPADVPMCSIGVDCSGGGDDPMIIAPRHDGWYARAIEVPGKEIPMDRSGAYCGGLIVGYRRDQALVVVDLGGGYGGPTYEHLKANDVEVVGFKGSEKTNRRSRDGKLRFVNKRSAALWLFREALDPGQPGGSPIMLPDDPILVADLTAPTFEPVPNGIRVESKEEVCARLGRSTDRGDGTTMAWFEGPKEATAALDWIERSEMKHGLGRMPRVILSRQPYTARMRAH